MMLMPVTLNVTQACVPINVITSQLASFETKTLWESPGFKYAGYVAATMAAAAHPGLNPARNKMGIMVGPTAAPKPESVGMEIEMNPATSIDAGNRKNPSFFNGRVRSVTRCTSHFVYEITAAKPIAEQIA